MKRLSGIDAQMWRGSLTGNQQMAPKGPARDNRRRDGSSNLRWVEAKSSR